MPVRDVVLKHLSTVVTNHSPLPFPDEASDDALLDDFWLDSIAFAQLITGIEGELGFIPNTILEGVSFPQTIGELVAAYQNEA